MAARSTLFAPLLFVVLASSLLFLSSEAASSQDVAASVEQPALGVAEPLSPAEQKAKGEVSGHGLTQEASVPLERHAASKEAAKPKKQLSSSLPLILAAITFTLLITARIVRMALATEKADKKEAPDGKEVSGVSTTAQRQCST
ncbi:hypothetical protein Emag_003257 [Eimeria magna]